MDEFTKDELLGALKWVNMQIAELEFYGALRDEYDDYLLYRLKQQRDELQAAVQL